MNTIITTRRPLLQSLLQLQDYSAPLFQLLLRPFVHHDHPPALVVRAPAVLFAALGLPASWWLARMLAGRRMAALSTCLLAVNPVFIQYATDGRPYSLFLLLSVTSMATFYRMMDRDRWGDVAAYVCSTSLLLYAHYYGFLVLPAQVGYAGIDMVMRRDKRRVRMLAAAFGTVALGALPALWLISRYVRSGLSALTFMARPRPMDLIAWPGELLGRDVLGVLVLVSLVFSSAFHPPLIVPEGRPREPIRRLDALRQWWDRERGAVLCLLWVASSLYSLFFVSRFVWPIYTQRYGVPVMVPLTILLTAAICRLRSVLLLPLLALVLGCMLPRTIHQFQSRSGYSGYPQLIASLRQQNSDNSRVLVIDWGDCENCVLTLPFGLEYYGLPRESYDLLTLCANCPQGLRDPDKMPGGERVFVIGEFDAVQLLIDNVLRYEPRAYRVWRFGEFNTLHLLEVEVVGMRAHWAPSDNAPPAVERPL